MDVRAYLGGVRAWLTWVNNGPARARVWIWCREDTNEEVGAVTVGEKVVISDGAFAGHVGHVVGFHGERLTYVLVRVPWREAPLYIYGMHIRRPNVLDELSDI